MIYSGGQEYGNPGDPPLPGDVVIGFKIHCGTEAPGLDTKRDRVVRISYRPGRIGPLPPKGLPRPPAAAGGAFPVPVKPGFDQGGVTMDETGTVWIDTQLFGQPPSDKRLYVPGQEPRENLGDDSEDMASRIEESVTSGVLKGLIERGDISVEHNGLSDTTPTGLNGQPQRSRDGKPQGPDGGRCRVVLRNPSHYDAASDYFKIETSIIEIPQQSPPGGGNGGGASGSLRLLPSTIPDMMPHERDGQPNKWEGTGQIEKPHPRLIDDNLTQPYLNDRVQWRRPRWRDRRWFVPTTHSEGASRLGLVHEPEGALPDDGAYLRIGSISSLGIEVRSVPIVWGLAQQLSAVASAMRSLGYQAKNAFGRVIFSDMAGSSRYDISRGLLIVFRNLPWRVMMERSVDGMQRLCRSGACSAPSWICTHSASELSEVRHRQDRTEFLRPPRKMPTAWGQPGNQPRNRT